MTHLARIAQAKEGIWAIVVRGNDSRCFLVFVKAGC